MNMYREQIMDHFRNPRNYGRIENPCVNFTDHNPFCGDEITMQAIIKEGKISEIKFQGKGCAISQASASITTEFVKGKSIDEVRKIGQEQIIQLLGIKLGPVRLKCALLALKALQKGIIKWLVKFEVNPSILENTN